MARRILESVGNRRAMPRADGPAEGDDSKETNIGVALPTTNAMDERKARLKMMPEIWRES